MRRSLVVLSALCLLLPHSTSAGTDGCEEPCSRPCLKPIAIADRWDDSTGISGYMGAGRRTPDWRNNRHWDHESFTDRNRNGLHDPSEPYVDGNENGKYDEEAYHRIHTGYGSGDIGLELVLHPGLPSDALEPGQYISIGLNGIPGGDAYRQAWAGCAASNMSSGPFIAEPGMSVGPSNQAIRNLIDLDPDATWDPATGSVQNSNFSISPRVFAIAVFDPRRPLKSDRYHLDVVKFVAFFAERMTGPAEVRGRFVQMPALRSNAEGIMTEHDSGPAVPNSWGRVKATYR